MSDCRSPFRLFWAIALISASTCSAAPNRDVATAVPLQQNSPTALLPQSTVGMTQRLEQVIIGGSELEPLPLSDARQPIVVRIVASYPHGTNFRYDLEYYGLEPGEFNLLDYLRRKDGSLIADAARLPVSIQSVLPPGQIEPNSLEPTLSKRLGGYRALLVGGGICWLLGLAAILLVGRQKRASSVNLEHRQTSFADRLRPLVEQASRHTFNDGQKAELERLLIAFWRKRLGLANLKPAEAIRKLREHEEAGQLLAQLEHWLHQPRSDQPADVAGLLAPYEKISADEFCDT